MNRYILPAALAAVVIVAVAMTREKPKATSTTPPVIPPVVSPPNVVPNVGPTDPVALARAAVLTQKGMQAPKTVTNEELTEMKTLAAQIATTNPSESSQLASAAANVLIQRLQA